MSDENKNDEYQFSELDSNQIFDEEVSTDHVKTSMPFENNLKKIILMGFGLLVIAFILYKFFGSYFVSNNSGATEISRLRKASVVKPTVTKHAIVKSKPVIALQPVTKAVVAKKYSEPQFNSYKPVNMDFKLKQKLNSLQYSSDQSTRKIANIDNNMGNLKNSLETLDSKIRSLNTNIALIAQEIQNQQEILKMLKKAKKKKSRKRIIKQAAKKFFIQALIPGRAWLRTSVGDSITVVVGTKIRGLGTVHFIDPQQGQVIMRTGKVIKFSSSDT